jgi:hypothetical protein
LVSEVEVEMKKREVQQYKGEVIVKAPSSSVSHNIQKKHVRIYHKPGKVPKAVLINKGKIEKVIPRESSLMQEPTKEMPVVKLRPRTHPENASMRSSDVGRPEAYLIHIRTYYQGVHNVWKPVIESERQLLTRETSNPDYFMSDNFGFSGRVMSNDGTKYLQEGVAFIEKQEKGVWKIGHGKGHMLGGLDQELIYYPISKEEAEEKIKLFNEVHDIEFALISFDSDKNVLNYASEQDKPVMADYHARRKIFDKKGMKLSKEYVAARKDWRKKARLDAEWRALNEDFNKTIPAAAIARTMDTMRRRKDELNKQLKGEHY